VRASHGSRWTCPGPAMSRRGVHHSARPSPYSQNIRTRLPTGGYALPSPALRLVFRSRIVKVFERAFLLEVTPRFEVTPRINELVASCANRSNLLQSWENTETCADSASGAYGPKNAAITRLPAPYAATESRHCSDRTALV
jgi:hypothetical protein